MPAEFPPPNHPLERLPEEWAAWVVAHGEPKYRGAQVFGWIQARGVFDPAQMTNLPQRLRGHLAKELDGLPLTISRDHTAPDDTRKLLVRMGDGKDVETVLIPQLRHDDPDVDDAEEESASRPVTQCISSQIGCAMGCVFCASGVAGLQRHLTCAEIVAQVLLGRQLSRASADPLHLRNVVFMGMGEPLHNYDAVARALLLLTHPDGLALSKRRVTVSTSGLVPQIDRLGQDFDGQVQLAISLHAVDDAQRGAIMPINRKHPLADLVASLRRYPLPKRRRITIEYTLIRGVNDDPADADRLVRLLRKVPVKVNLIPMNPIEESTLGAPTWAGVEAFRDRIRDAGMTATIRRQRGAEVDAACGQLALYGPSGERSERRRRLPVAPEVTRD